ncbi:MAG: hypothetical protein G01um10145_755 [Microgenomates group bacterium Gr01-1014_5]|nr:MAG: hypothetical protein G01um10145_755 [Microgenomates group bacterium Gr01-1014_5]
MANEQGQSKYGFDDYQRQKEACNREEGKRQQERAERQRQTLKPLYDRFREPLLDVLRDYCSSVRFKGEVETCLDRESCYWRIRYYPHGIIDDQSPLEDTLVNVRLGLDKGSPRFTVSLSSGLTLRSDYESIKKNTRHLCRVVQSVTGLPVDAPYTQARGFWKRLFQE